MEKREMNNKHLALNTALKMILVFCAMIAIGFALLFAVYCIPGRYLTENLKKSYAVIEKEGLYPHVTLHTSIYNSNDDIVTENMYSYVLMDNFADTIALLLAGYGSENGSPVTNTLLNPYYRDFDELPDIALKRSLYSEGELITTYYSRYWMGFLTYIKPLLVVTSYTGIRQIFGIVELLLVVLVLFFCIKRGKAFYCIPIVVSFCFLVPKSISMSIEFSPVFFITFVQLLIILIGYNKYSNKRIWLYHFLTVGCITSYMDFLTYPLASFTIPFLLMASFYNTNVREDIFEFIKCGISWAWGYIGMWASKWVLASVFTDTNVIQDAIQTVMLRSQGGFKEYDHKAILKEVIMKNVNAVSWFLPVFAAGIIVGLIIAIMRKQFKIIFIYILVAVLPFVWYIAASNHSFVHSFFTFRTLSVSLFAAFALIARTAELKESKAAGENENNTIHDINDKGKNI